jgi:[protein-PII] uridylyltransferase
MSSRASLSASALDAREQLRAERAHMRQLHERGLDSMQICARLTSLVDSIVQRIFSESLLTLEPPGLGAKDAAGIQGQIALVGHGGYGRRQSAPFSDVDLMILYEGRESELISELARLMNQGIFDAGLQLGHSVRSVQEAVGLARTDPIILTSLIDVRLVAGTQSVLEGLRTNFERMVQRRGKSLAHDFLEARARERSQYGETVYLLEPHIKRSRGGTRDLNLLRWLGYVEHGAADPDRRRMMGAMSKFDHHRLLSAREFLLKVRNEMHFHADKANETLARAEQVRIAEQFGYRRSEGLLPVEKFMRDYFRHTNHVWHMVRRREAGLQSGSAMTRAVSWIGEPVLGKKKDGPYRIGMRNISTTVAGIDNLKSDLGEVLRLVRLSAHHGKPLDHTIWSALYLAAPGYSDQLNPDIARQFYQLLADPELVGEIVRVLHELGLLEKFIPAMRHARWLLQFNQYHKYTVDEHSLRAVRLAARFCDRDDALGMASQQVEDKRLLHLALLMHDLGKGFEQDHSVVGAQLAAEEAQRLGLSTEDAQDLVFLVENHLRMSHLALRRDTSDQQVIAYFAQQVETPKRLRMLFVLTCADLAAVGPDVLTAWKTEMLATLYRRALRVLQPSDPADGRSTTEAKFADLRHRVLQRLPDQERHNHWYRNQVARLPRSYLTHRDPDEAVTMLCRLRQLTDGAADAWGSYKPETQTVEYLVGVDRGLGRGVFSSMAGALTSLGMEILDADAEALADSLLLLRFVVTDPDYEGAPPRHRLQQVQEQLIGAVDSDEPPKFRRVWGAEQAEADRKLSPASNRVLVDNRASEQCTVVEIFTFDRTGLLYSLARKLHDLHLVIQHAKIGTSLDQVVDAFYVTERSGGKVTDKARVEEIREEVLAVIETADMQ